LAVVRRIAPRSDGFSELAATILAALYAKDSCVEEAA
jgi:hypothetical protein